MKIFKESNEPLSLKLDEKLTRIPYLYLILFLNR